MKNWFPLIISPLQVTVKRIFFLLCICCFITLKSSALNYYWVGGTGNWSDLSHWATTSGGSTLHNQIPSAVDDVYFDGGSFNAAGQTVTLNASTIFCRDMSWQAVTNTPTLSGLTQNILKIYGTLTFVSGMNVNFLSMVNFEATSTGKTITMAGKAFRNGVFFNGIGGEWTLLDEFRAPSVSLNSGILNSNNQTVNLIRFFAGSATLNMSSSIFNVSGGSINPAIPDSWSCSSTIINCGTSTINCTANNPQFRGGNSTYYDLNFTSTNSTNSKLFGNNTFRNVFSNSKISLYQSNSIQNASFLGDALLDSSNIFTNLNFSAGHSYKLRSGATQTINGVFNAIGNCGALIDISSTTSGSQASISKLSGTVNISFGILKDIIATGGASFAANNSIDLGNNQDWTFTSPSPQNLYWVGNSGNWDDGNHWSYVSGGAPSGCSPSPNDNVFFDVNSFNSAGQSVTLNTSTAYCKDMNWQTVSNNPTLTGLTQNQLKIYGSLTFVSGMNINFLAKVNFEATSTGKTITMGGKSFRSNVFFNGIGGEWTLLDEFRSINNLTLNRGTLNTNNQTVNILAFEAGAATLYMGSSIFNIANSLGANTESWSVSSSTILNCGTSTINCTGNRPEFKGGGFNIL